MDELEQQPPQPIDSWLFTFGHGHLAPHHYVRMDDMTFGEARAFMFSLVGDKWSMQYPLKDLPKIEGFMHGGCLRHFGRHQLPGSLRERHDI